MTSFWRTCFDEISVFHWKRILNLPPKEKMSSTKESESKWHQNSFSSSAFQMEQNKYQLRMTGKNSENLLTTSSLNKTKKTKKLGKSSPAN